MKISTLEFTTYSSNTLRISMIDISRFSLSKINSREIQSIMEQWASSPNASRLLRLYWTLILTQFLELMTFRSYSFKFKILRVRKTWNLIQESTRMCWVNSSICWAQQTITELWESLNILLSYCLLRFWIARMLTSILLSILPLTLETLSRPDFLPI